LTCLFPPGEDLVFPLPIPAFARSRASEVLFSRSQVPRPLGSSTLTGHIERNPFFFFLNRSTEAKLLFFFVLVGLGMRLPTLLFSPRLPSRCLGIILRPLVLFFSRKKSPQRQRILLQPHFFFFPLLVFLRVFLFRILKRFIVLGSVPSHLNIAYSDYLPPTPKDSFESVPHHSFATLKAHTLLFSPKRNSFPERPFLLL